MPSGVVRSSSRTPYEEGSGSVILHTPCLERILDHTFSQLHFADSSIDMPLLMTEAVANPPYCRRECSELLFEAYQVPRVAYALDGPLAWHANVPAGSGDALIITIGHHSTVIMMVLGGETRPEWIRRINFGASHASDMLLQLMQVKYPNFPVKMLPWQAEAVLHHAAVVALDYDAVLGELAAPDAAALAATNVVVQYPYSTETLAERLQKEAAREQLAERRREQAQKLRERAERQRAEKLEAKQQQIESMRKLERRAISGGTVRSDGGFDDEAEEQSLDQLRLYGYQSLEELQEAIEAEQKELNRLLGIEEPKETPDYSLVDVPDADLSPEQIKEKRRQRLLKNAAEARERLRREKEEAERKQAEQRAREEEHRTHDFDGWRRDLYAERERINETLRQRQKRKEALADRRSQAAGARLRNVVSLVADGDEEGDEEESANTTAAAASGASRGRGGKRKRGGGSGSGKRVRGVAAEAAAAGGGEGEDGFGDDDADWLIYRQISRDDEAEGEEEEQLTRRLAEVEEQLEQHDQEAFLDVLAVEMSSAVTILDRLQNGGPPPSTKDDAQIDPNALANRLNVNVERYRITEGLFQPSAILGLDQAGLIEAIEDLVKLASPSCWPRLFGNVFVTGGFGQVRGLAERLQAELRALAPAEIPVRISLAHDAHLDAWRGGAQLARSSPTTIPWITKAWYEEHGGERLPGHAFFTNQF